MLVISCYLKRETDEVFKFYFNDSFTLKKAVSSNKLHTFKLEN